MFERITILDEARRASSAGLRLEELKRAAPRVKEKIGSSGKPMFVRTYDQITFPYPARYGLQGTALLPSPYVMLRNRMLVVRFVVGGVEKTLLINPSDYERSMAAPFFAHQIEFYGEFLSRKVLTQRHGTLESALADAGIRPDEVDYLVFDHLHVQDLRRLLGEGALFPKAVLLAQRQELAIFENLHPLQRPWFVAEGLYGIPHERMVALDGDYLLGPGVALLFTPGHTAGNQTIVLHTDRGIYTISENGIALDAYAADKSRIPGLRRYAKLYDLEMVLNANTREQSLEQYTSMVLEKAIADTCPESPEFPNHFPSSEMVPHPLALGLSPTRVQGAVVQG